MRLGRFIVDTHVHAQRFAAGPQLAGKTGYPDLASAMVDMEAYDNSARLLYDMERYGVDMCVLLPAFGMSNELNAQLVERYPDKFVACCGAVETAKAALRGEIEWTPEAAAQELDRLLSTGKFVGIGEGIPYNPRRRTSLSITERLDEMRVILEVARKHRVPARIHTGVVQGYPLTHHIFPESLQVLWLTDLAAEFPDVPLILDHGGMQAGYLERWVEEALHVAGSHDNVFLETGLWWAELYER
ncbi:MAG: amidohydrolase family protein, partial [Armatimonadetes bacterium]|nr:amidohydrolase family protein [Armatimonadota bacterium]MDW8153843.1 amidohydrolase family protein [Armatimonadota bacterium]